MSISFQFETEIFIYPTHISSSSGFTLTYFIFNSYDGKVKTEKKLIIHVCSIIIYSECTDLVIKKKNWLAITRSFLVITTSFLVNTIYFIYLYLYEIFLRFIFLKKVLNWLFVEHLSSWNYTFVKMFNIVCRHWYICISKK